jgi:hypothetical protein
MAAKHVFLSFVEEDLDLARLFRGQAKNKNSDLSFDDYSVKVPYNSSDAAYIRSKIKERIRTCSVLVCLIGKDTHKSPWVDWEIRTAADLDKKIVGVRLRRDHTDTLPTALVELKASICGWDIDSIVKLIG